ncbi:DUF4129 domain-containing protein [Kitasatospora sp. NPDC051853]|uniref:DUF4129 domain-containing protein n=1 Tax=Kitasatospora sp. NPDC051853 TaxID=3364058 RepID=UPI0037AC2397
MGGRVPGPGGRLRPVLALVAVGCLAFAALALRPSEGPGLLAATGPLARYGWLLGLAFGVGGIVLAAKDRAVLREAWQGQLSPVAERLAAAATTVLRLTVVVLPLFLLLLAAKSCDHAVPPEPAPTPSPSLSRAADPGRPSTDTSWVEVLVLLIALALLLALLVIVVVQVVRWFQDRRRRGRRARLGAGAKAGAIGEEALAEAVASGRRALTGSDARTAVIACYLAMETSLAESGVARHHSDSPADLLHRAALAGVVTGPHPQALAALFREARYSSHPMGEEQLAGARAALDAIAAQLGHPAAPAVPSATSTAPTEEAR